MNKQALSTLSRVIGALFLSVSLVACKQSVDQLASAATAVFSEAPAPSLELELGDVVAVESSIPFNSTYYDTAVAGITPSHSTSDPQILAELPQYFMIENQSLLSALQSKLGSEFSSYQQEYNVAVAAGNDVSKIQKFSKNFKMSARLDSVGSPVVAPIYFVFSGKMLILKNHNKIITHYWGFSSLDLEGHAYHNIFDAQWVNASAGLIRSSSNVYLGRLGRVHDLFPSHFYSLVFKDVEHSFEISPRVESLPPFDPSVVEHIYFKRVGASFLKEVLGLPGVESIKINHVILYAVDKDNHVVGIFHLNEKFISRKLKKYDVEFCLRIQEAGLLPEDLKCTMF